MDPVNIVIIYNLKSALYYKVYRLRVAGIVVIISIAVFYNAVSVIAFCRVACSKAVPLFIAPARYPVWIYPRMKLKPARVSRAYPVLKRIKAVNRRNALNP